MPVDENPVECAHGDDLFLMETVRNILGHCTCTI